MAIVGTIKICMDCKGELPEVVPQHCPHCGSDSAHQGELRRKEATLAKEQKWATNSIHGQHQVAAQDLAKSQDPDIITQRTMLEQDLNRALRESHRYLPRLEKRYVMMDAVQIMKCILHSNLPPEDISAIVKLGKQIGEIAEGAEKFIRALGMVPKE